MKAAVTGGEIKYLSTLAVGLNGVGKTKFGLDHPGVVYVDCGEQKRGENVTALDMGIKVPTLYPETYTDLRSLTLDPLGTVAQYHPEVKPQSFIFDSLWSLGMLLMGKKPLSETRDGKLTIVQAATGVMAQERKIAYSDRPDPQDYGEAMDRLDSILQLISSMPFHTVMTANLEHTRTEDSPKGFNAAATDISYSWFPITFGKLRYRVANRFDFLLHFERKSDRFVMNPIPRGAVNARTRLQSRLNAPIDWTGKNGYEILWEKVQEEKR